MRKRQKDSCSATSSGVNSKTISNLRPARTVPLRVVQRKTREMRLSVLAWRSASLSHTKSYGTEVGLTTKKRRVLRTFVPSDSNSITLVAGSSGPREPSGPGISGDLRPSRT